ncbi:MAG: hypothetical protein QM479_02655 [Pseudomonadota bacterium]
MTLVYLMSIPVSLSQDVELLVKVNKNKVEIGKYLSVRIIYTGNNLPESSNIKSWYKNFYIEARDTETEKLANGSIRHIEFLRLYPRVVGDMVLHSIAQGGAISQPIKIKVKAAIRNGVNADPHWLALPKTIWQGQTIKISLSQNLLAASNQVFVDKFILPGFTVIGPEQLTVSESTVSENTVSESTVSEQISSKQPKSPNKSPIVELNWLITANNYGTFDLQLPAIIQRGRGRWNFYLPAKSIRVKPLPSYLPSTIAVGKLSLQTGIIYQQETPFWFIELHNQGQLAEEVYGIRSQLAKLTGVDSELIQLVKTQASSKMDLTFVQRYQLPIPQWSWGFNHGPKLVISYFDVDKGQLQSVSKQLPTIWHIPKKWQIIFFSLLAFMVLVCLWLVFRFISQIKAWLAYRALLSHSDDANKLRKLLLAQGNYLSLEAWAIANTLSKRPNPAKYIAGQLNSLCYARETAISVKSIQVLLIELHSFTFWLKITENKQSNQISVVAQPVGRATG